MFSEVSGTVVENICFQEWRTPNYRLCIWTLQEGTVRTRSSKCKSDPWGWGRENHVKSLESEPTFQGLSRKLRQICTFHLGCVSFVVVEENAFVHNSGVSCFPIGMKNKINISWTSWALGVQLLFKTWISLESFWDLILKWVSVFIFSLEKYARCQRPRCFAQSCIDM